MKIDDITGLWDTGLNTWKFLDGNDKYDDYMDAFKKRSAFEEFNSMAKLYESMYDANTTRNLREANRQKGQAYAHGATQDELFGISDKYNTGEGVVQPDGTIKHVVNVPTQYQGYGGRETSPYVPQGTTQTVPSATPALNTVASVPNRIGSSMASTNVNNNRRKTNPVNSTIG